MKEAELKAIRKRAEAATDGPWRVGCGSVETDSPEHQSVSSWWGGTSNNICNLNDGEYIENSNEDSDAEFIAHAREDVPALLAEIERLRKQFEYIAELADDFYEVDYVDEKGVIVMSVPDELAKHRQTVQEIFIITNGEVVEYDGEEDE